MLLVWVLKIENEPQELKKWPLISIWVAARNEEDNLERCVKALLALDYPKDSVQILLGNDSSEDGTWELMSRLKEEHPEIIIVDIKDQLGTARGKANVLAHLEKESTGDYFLITDADIAVPPSWAKEMVGEIKRKDNTGVVTGTTIIKKGGPWNELQSLDWVFAIGLIKTLSDLKIPVSAMGNNMIVSRQAYEETGGYEVIPFNITEDYELYKQIIKRKYRFSHLYNPKVLASSEPVKGVSALLHQRKRWMRGATQLKFALVFILLMNGVFYPAMVTLSVFNPTLGLSLLAVKFFVQSIFMLYLMDRLKVLRLVIYLPLYELYSILLTTSLLVFYILPVKVRWKGRQY